VLIVRQRPNSSLLLDRAEADQGFKISGLGVEADQGFEISGLGVEADQGFKISGLAVEADQGFEISGLTVEADQGFEISGFRVGISGLRAGTARLMGQTSAPANYSLHNALWIRKS